MSFDDIQKLQSVEQTMLEIEAQMIASGFGDEVRKAQVLYVCALYEIAINDPQFTAKLVSCFAPDISDEALISNINSTFGIDISVDDFKNLLSRLYNNDIDTSKYIMPETKNNLDLVTWCDTAYKNGWGYVYGTFGWVLDEATVQQKLNQYPDYMVQWLDFIHANWMGRRCVDCIGLIKGYGWLDPETKAINYGSNGMPDMNADTARVTATVSGPISTMPEIPGLAVCMEGHIGVYIGNGEVIEAMGAQYGVVKTRLSEGSWTMWIRIPAITYIDEHKNLI